jgi:GxxExxY protein
MKKSREDKHEGHEEIEDHDEELPLSFGVRVASPVSAEAERVMHQTIGCAIAVHRALGPGFLESIYRSALCLEFDARHMVYERERPVHVRYRGVNIPGQRIDLIVQGVIVVELKAVEQFHDRHRAQLVSYLRTTGIRGGLLVNFGARVLKDGLLRVVV